MLIDHPRRVLGLEKMLPNGNIKFLENFTSLIRSAGDQLGDILLQLSRTRNTIIRERTNVRSSF